MHVINFLPDDYVKRRGLRRANLLCIAVAGGGLLVIGLVVGFVFIQALGTTAMRAVVERQYEDASRQIENLKQLEERKTGLLHKVELSTTLLERVPRSHLLAHMTNCLPTNTSLTALTMHREDVTVPVPASAEAAPPDPAPAKGAGKGAGKSTSGKTAKPATMKVTRVKFRLDGLAPTDVQVAEYITKLGSDPLFEDIDLQFSEEFPYKENVTMRRFQLYLLLSQDAERLLEKPPVQEAVTVSPVAATVKGES